MSCICVFADFRMSGNVSPKDVALETLKEEIHALLCAVKGSVPSDQIMSNIYFWLSIYIIVFS
jgi:hypothetical protein